MSAPHLILPTIGAYAEAVANPEGRFATLRGVRGVTDSRGELSYTCGAGRVTFRVELDGEPYDLTCFTTPAALGQGEQKRYGNLLPRELYVFRADGTGDYFPVAVRKTHSPNIPHIDSPSITDPQTPTALGEWSEGLQVAVLGDRFGYLDPNGLWAIEPQFVWAGDFCGGRADGTLPVPNGEEGTLMGLIDPNGALTIPAVYDDLSWDGSRYAYVERDGRHGCLDRTGHTVVPLEYDWMGEFSYGFAVVSREERWGYVDERGQLVGEGLAYADARSVGEDGIAEVRLSGSDTYTPVRLF